MSNVRIENDFGRKVAPGSVDSEEALFSHCRVGKEDREREAGQASPEAFGCTHTSISTTKFKSQNVTNIPSLDCMTTGFQDFSNADSQSALCRFHL